MATGTQEINTNPPPNQRTYARASNPEPTVHEDTRASAPTTGKGRGKGATKKASSSTPANPTATSSATATKTGRGRGRGVTKATRTTAATSSGRGKGAKAKLQVKDHIVEECKKQVICALLFISSETFQVQQSHASSSSSSAAAAGRGRGIAGTGRGAAVQPDNGQTKTYGRSSSGRIYSRFTFGGKASTRDGAAGEE